MQLCDLLHKDATHAIKIYTFHNTFYFVQHCYKMFTVPQYHYFERFSRIVGFVVIEWRELLCRQDQCYQLIMYTIVLGCNQVCYESITHIHAMYSYSILNMHCAAGCSTGWCMHASHCKSL